MTWVSECLRSGRGLGNSIAPCLTRFDVVRVRRKLVAGSRMHDPTVLILVGFKSSPVYTRGIQSAKGRTSCAATQWKGDQNDLRYKPRAQP